MDKSEQISNIVFNSKFRFSYFNKIFEGNLSFIWPFIIFEDLAFLKLLMAKFGLFNLFGPSNPDCYVTPGPGPGWIRASVTHEGRVGGL